MPSGEQIPVALQFVGWAFFPLLIMGYLTYCSILDSIYERKMYKEAQRLRRFLNYKYPDFPHY